MIYTFQNTSTKNLRTIQLLDLKKINLERTRLRSEDQSELNSGGDRKRNFLRKLIRGIKKVVTSESNSEIKKFKNQEKVSRKHHTKGLANLKHEIKRALFEIKKLRKNFWKEIIPFLIRVIRVIIRRLMAAFIPFIHFVKAYDKVINGAHYALPELVTIPPKWFFYACAVKEFYWEQFRFFSDYLVFMLFSVLQKFSLGHPLVRFNYIFCYMTDLLIYRFIWVSYFPLLNHYHRKVMHLLYVDSSLLLDYPNAIQDAAGYALAWIFFTGGFYIRCCIYALLGMYPYIPIITASALIWVKSSDFRDFMD